MRLALLACLLLAGCVPYPYAYGYAPYGYGYGAPAGYGYPYGYAPYGYGYGYGAPAGYGYPYGYGYPPPYYPSPATAEIYRQHYQNAPGTQPAPMQPVPLHP